MVDRILLFKAGTGLILALGSLALAVSPLTYRISRRAFSLGSFALLVASRLATFAAVYLILAEPAQSDLGLYYSWTKALIDGGTLYSQDVLSCYAPLFHYIAAVPLLLWDHHGAIVLTAIAFEVAAFPIWLSIGWRIFDEQTARRATALYVINPLPLWCAAVYGQNQSWVAFFLAIAIWLMVRQQHLASGAAMALSTAAVKFLPLLYVPALVLSSSRPVRWCVGFAIVNAVVYGGFLAYGFDVLAVFHYIAAEISSGNLPFMLTAIGFDGWSAESQRIVSIAGVIILGMLAWAMLWKTLQQSSLENRPPGRDPQRMMYLITVLGLVFMLVSKKSHTTYLVMAFMPLCYTIAMSRPRALVLAFFALFSAAGTVEQSVWFRWFRLGDLSGHYPPSQADAVLDPPGAAALISLLVLQAIVLTFYCWAAWQAWRFAFASPRNQDRQAVASRA